MKRATWQLARPKLWKSFPTNPCEQLTRVSKGHAKYSYIGGPYQVADFSPTEREPKERLAKNFFLPSYSEAVYTCN